jgi:polysaccharide pyruvyl transferase WcaK-like protein
MLSKIDAAEFVTENAVIGGDFNHSKFKSPGAYLVQGDYDKSLIEILRQFHQSAEDYMSVDLNHLNDSNFSFNHSRPNSIIFPLKFSVFFGNFLRKYKFYIGSRIHGCIIANYYGIPAICTNWDMRAIEMCTYLKIPHIMNFPSVEDASEFLETFNSAIDYQNASYSELHSTYLNFLNKNELIYVEE